MLTRDATMLFSSDTSSPTLPIHSTKRTLFHWPVACVTLNAVHSGCGVCTAYPCEQLRNCRPRLCMCKKCMTCFQVRAVRGGGGGGGGGGGAQVEYAVQRKKGGGNRRIGREEGGSKLCICDTNWVAGNMQRSRAEVCSGASRAEVWSAGLVPAFPVTPDHTSCSATKRSITTPGISSRAAALGSRAGHAAAAHLVKAVAPEPFVTPWHKAALHLQQTQHSRHKASVTESSIHYFIHQPKQAFMVYTAQRLAAWHCMPGDRQTLSSHAATRHRHRSACRIQLLTSTYGSTPSWKGMG